MGRIDFLKWEQFLKYASRYYKTGKMFFLIIDKGILLRRNVATRYDSALYLNPTKEQKAAIWELEKEGKIEVLEADKFWWDEEVKEKRGEEE